MIGDLYKAQRKNITLLEISFKALILDIDKKKAYDILFHYDNFIINCNHKKIDKIMLDYIIESLFNKAKYLENNEYNEYIKQLKNRRVAHKIYAYNYKKLIKKFISIISINLYIKIFVNKRRLS